MKKKTDKEAKEIIIDMPEVKDIPGQEHIKPPRLREMMDSTPSSSSDEGEGLLDDLNKEDDDSLIDQDTNVSATEKEALSKADRPVTEEDLDLEGLALDETDDEDALNEKSDPKDMGADLDIPGAELDDAEEETGEEDEENNAYSGRD